MEQLSSEKITELLGGTGLYSPVICYGALPSTNRKLKEEAGRGAPEGTVILADRQTAGYGRSGRSFFSPGGTGLYMSILLRPKGEREPLTLTAMAGVAVCEALETLTGRTAGIKWVNDILMDGKKVCGILAEGCFRGETPESIVLGIGVNLYLPESGFGELSGIAGAVCRQGEKIDRNRLAALLLSRFEEHYLGGGDLFPVYRKRLLFVGEEASVLRGGEERRARILGLNRDLSLAVRYENGEREDLSSGEVSVKPHV